MEEIKTAVFLTIFCLFAAAAAAAEVRMFKSICQGKENILKLTVYVQDVRGGPNATVVTAAEAPVTSTSPTSFGQIHIIDDLITAEPDINSAPVGRAQGLTTSADLKIRAIAMNLNFVFTAGKLNGSTISILGRNQIGDPARELPVVGGTGFFRFARGYAVTTTYSNDAATNYGVLQYTFYITYYSVGAPADI